MKKPATWPELHLGVLQHHPAEGPGRIAGWARRRGVRLTVVDAPAWFAERPDLADWDALVLLGGPWNLHPAPPAWLAAEQQAVAGWLASGRPALGICLGAQVMAAAAGARVQPMATPETGWQPIEWADGTRFEALQWHGQAFDLPPGAQRLAWNAYWACQGFALSPAQWAVQFHPEWNDDAVAQLHDAFGPATPLPRTPSPDQQAAVARWFDAALDRWVQAF